MFARQRRFTMAGKIADCRRWPSETNCSLTIIGEEEEVIRAAAERAALREFLEDEDTYMKGKREKEAMPG
jgi:hypothetical protein